MAWRGEPHGGDFLSVKERLGTLQFLDFYQEREHALLGNREIGNRGLQHLKLRVSSQIIKIRQPELIFILFIHGRDPCSF